SGVRPPCHSLPHRQSFPAGAAGGVLRGRRLRPRAGLEGLLARPRQLGPVEPSPPLGRRGGRVPEGRADELARDLHRSGVGGAGGRGGGVRALLLSTAEGPARGGRKAEVGSGKWRRTEVEGAEG